MSSHYKEFNKAAKALIKDIILVFPEADILKLISCYFAMLKRVSKKRPQRYFCQIVEIPHGQYIINKDVEYFTSDRFQSNDWKALVDFTREKLRSLDQKNIDTLFNHLVLLVALSKKCNNVSTSFSESPGQSDIDS